MLQRGQLFAGRYVVGEPIAQGGMGAVYEAKHALTGERVALKVLCPQAFGSSAAAKNFQLEARAASMLGGEHVVRVFDAGFDEELHTAFLAMELLRGDTLDALVRARGPLAPAEVLWAMRQVAEALDRAHRHVDRAGRPAPVVHRDLKPENLFLAERERGGLVVKVLDFGIAKVLSGRQTLSQELRGTPLFMACEQIEGGELTPRVDLWALGLIAFYLMAGRHYWHSARKPEAGLAPLFNEVLRLPIEPPTERARAFGLAPAWAPAFDPWFLRCLDRDPERRFDSAGAAVEALAAALDVGAERAPAPLGPGHGRAELEATAPGAAPAPVAKAGKPKAGAAPLRTTLVAERLLRQSTTSDFGGSSSFVRSQRNRSKQRVLRGVWGAAGFVTGGALTALVLHGGLQPPARPESAAALSPGAADLEALAAPPAEPAPEAPPAPPAAEAPPAVGAAPRADAAQTAAARPVDATQAAAAPPADSAKPPAAPPPAAPKVVRAPAPKRPALPARPDAPGRGPGPASGGGVPAEALDIELSR